MGVTVTDPTGASFPDGNGWTVYLTIDSGDDVDGTLLDYRTNDVYPDDGPTCIGGPDVQGRYTWEVPFTPDTNVHNTDDLQIHCYDDETGDGAIWDGTASEQGYSPPKREVKTPRDGAPSISIEDNSTLDKDAKTVTARVRLAAQTKGNIFLVLTNRDKDPKKDPSAVLIRRCCLALSGQEEDRLHTFQGIDESAWTHIHVIAVTKGHQGYPIVNGRPMVPVKTIKCPPAPL